MGQIKVTNAPIKGLYIIEPAVHGDERGYFVETYNQRDMHEAGLDMVFVQDNQSMSWLDCISFSMFSCNATYYYRLCCRLFKRKTDYNLFTDLFVCNGYGSDIFRCRNYLCVNRKSIYCCCRWIFWDISCRYNHGNGIETRRISGF